MKLKIFPSLIYGDQRCVRARAVINKSKKLKIPRRFTKTWSMKTVAPEFDAVELEKTIRAEAERWEKKVMAKINGEKPPAIPHQGALLDVESSFNPKTDLLA